MPVLVRLTHTDSPMTAGREDDAWDASNVAHIALFARPSLARNLRLSSQAIIHACRTRPQAHRTKHKQCPIVACSDQTHQSGRTARHRSLPAHSIAAESRSRRATTLASYATHLEPLLDRLQALRVTDRPL
ncbi:uncharacterized protein LAESUDRAFT_729138 [Laetiporus sulphureus 93-53]|uniref:Uncharacterized protein n=1 Tax=Laetiporus sulphureus 93-53 TaxID=1314785 RepID=A0A165CW30_9APHY|nr:uncharacterized protein LAESUDRAFT_729138 [Laetiporus sulphureus 93-53]KZT03551.1 hypothetical protein LAESUDRAFT_729138 [Laetiporus sulphureus 93-53]